MPDALAGMSDEKKKKSAKAITHFLTSITKSAFRPVAPDAVAAEFGVRLEPEPRIVQFG